MWAMFKSLRFRLVATFVLVTGMINALLGMGGIALREWQVRAAFDQSLEQHADELIRWIRARGAPDQLEEVLDHPSPPVEPDLLVEVRKGERVVSRSTSLQGSTMPFIEPGRDDAARFTTLSPLDLDPPPRRFRAPLRMVTKPVFPETRRDVWLQVARSTEAVEESMAYLSNLFWIIMPTGLIVAGVAGWLVTNRALNPLDTLSQAASEINTRHLDQRLEVAGANNEIARLTRELNHMLGRLEGSFRAQERFIISASHELQTPVAVVLSQAQVLKAQDGATPEDFRGFVDSVEQEMRQLRKMIGTLLSVVRMESGELERTQKLLSLNDVVVQAVDDCSELAHRRHITYRLTLPDPDDAGREPLVTGDAGLLGIMVENLVRNATRYAPDSSQVDVSLELDGDQAVVTVTDRGPAVPDGVVRSLFDRSLPEPVSGGRSGAGLNLAIARTIAELHHGTIGFRTQAEGGAAFFVWLPLAEDGQAARLE